MRLSVIIPALDEATAIGSTLAALAPLVARGAEVVVVDGGSRDATARIAREHGARVVAAGRGRARQMNAGAAVARGDTLLFLHADTRLPASADALVQDALQRCPWGRFDVRIEGDARTLALVGALMNLRSRLTGIATGDQAMFATREAFAAVGGFPEQPLMEDIELSRRLRRLARPACLRERAVTSGRRWMEHGVWRTILLMWRLRLAYWLGASPERLRARYERRG